MMPGRPAVFKDPVRVVVTMERADLEKARKLGNGVVAAGVRVAIQAAAGVAMDTLKNLTHDGLRFRALIKGHVSGLDVYDNARRYDLAVASEDSIAARCDAAIQKAEVKS